MTNPNLIKDALTEAYVFITQPRRIYVPTNEHTYVITARDYNDMVDKIRAAVALVGDK